ncbi:MAG: prephenate dehydrogenase [Bacteroidota bacterium]
MKLTVIGLGHIGGTLAKTLKKVHPSTQVMGVDSNPDHVTEALSAGWIDTSGSLTEAVAWAEVVALAIPVAPMKTLLPQVLDSLAPGAWAFDLGSTKLAICETIAQHPKRSQFVAAHPIAGTENSGPTAAMDDLFQGKRMILCETDKSHPEAVQHLEQLCQAMQMDLLYMGAQEHDEHLAYISHLSHLTSFSLALSVLQAEKYEDMIFQFAGSGFASTARLGKSSPDMWTSIFLENKEPLLRVLSTYTDMIGHFRQAIENDDPIALQQLMTEANDIRRILEGKTSK